VVLEWWFPALELGIRLTVVVTASSWRQRCHPSPAFLELMTAAILSGRLVAPFVCRVVKQLPWVELGERNDER